MQRNGRVGVKSRKAPKDVCASSALMSDNRIYARIAWRERVGYKTNRTVASFHCLPALGAAQAGKGARP